MSRNPTDETDEAPPSAPEELEPTAAPEERVGYGRPPRHSRFKPGQSGNPRGRPKGAKNINTVVFETLNRKVTVSLGGKQKQVLASEAMILRLAELALKGDQKAIAFFYNFEERRKKDSGMQEDGADTHSCIDPEVVIEDFLARHKPDHDSGA